MIQIQLLFRLISYTDQWCAGGDGGLHRALAAVADYDIGQSINFSGGYKRICNINAVAISKGIPGFLNGTDGRRRNNYGIPSPPSPSGKKLDNFQQLFFYCRNCPECSKLLPCHYPGEISP
jgi:hypothetical protein